MKFTFYHRVVLLLTALVLLIQLGNLSAVLTHVRHDAEQKMLDDLAAGSNLVEQLARQRSTDLQKTARDLAVDLNLRFAIASNNPSAIQSTLRNRLGRIDATLATYIATNGKQFGHSQIQQQDADAYRALLTQAASDKAEVTTMILQGTAKQVVAVPVGGSIPNGWLVLGIEFDDRLAQEFSEQMDMQVTFALKLSRYELSGSTLSQTQRTSLRELLQSRNDNTLTIAMDGSEYLTQIVPLGTAAIPAYIVLQVRSDTAMQGYYQVRQNLVGYMGICLAISLALGIWFARGVSRPVKLLAQAARQIQKGDYDIGLDLSLNSHRGDEFGELITVFADMQSGIAEREKTILYQALFDDTTDLPNRRHSLDLLHALMSENPTEDSTIIFIGMNQYRQIVDTLGQKVADDVVFALSKRLKHSFSDALLLARVSTDAFLLVLPLSADPELVSYVQALLVELASPITLPEAEMLPDLRAGVAVIPQDAKTANDAMRRASIALNEAREGHVSVCRYVAGHDESQTKSLSIVADLKRAVEEDQLTLHYQPKINVISGKVDSVEALVRWIHPEHGFMAPDEFISLAECSGYISILTQWVLNTAIKQISKWHDQGIPLKVAVNLSALDLQDVSLFSSIEQLLANHGVPTTKLIIEVTESAMLRDAEQALATLRLMRAHGVTISIDDFGTGYSSLSKLKDLPIDELKIDRAFVTNIEPGTTECHIVKAIVDLGHSVGLTVIAEGVETTAEWDLLESLGNDVIQGYLVSRPLNASDLTIWWNDRYRKNADQAA